MIKANELKIGNLVLFAPSGKKASKPRQVIITRLHEASCVTKDIGAAALELFYSSEELQPIPLSPEILEKLGFSHEGKPSVINGQDFYQVYSYGIFTFNSNHGWWVNNWNLPVQPKYLHQLQNLIFALTGEELEVKGI